MGLNTVMTKCGWCLTSSLIVVSVFLLLAVDLSSAVNRLTTSTGRKCECTCEPSAILEAVETLPDFTRYLEGSMTAPDLPSSKGRTRSHVTKFSYSATHRRHHQRASSSNGGGIPAVEMSPPRFDKIFPPGAEEAEPRNKPESDAEVEVFIPKPVISSSRFDGTNGQRPDKDAEWFGEPTGYSTQEGMFPSRKAGLGLLKQMESGKLKLKPDDETGRVNNGLTSRARLSVCHLKFGGYDDYPCKIYCELKGQIDGKCSGTGICECGRVG